MKKLVLTLMVIVNTILVLGQWTFKKVQNDFDDPYKIAYTGRNNEAILKLEIVETERTIQPKMIQDSIFTVTKTENPILIYDSVSSEHCLPRGYMSLYSDEYVVIYDVITCQPSNAIAEETFYKVYANNRFGSIRATALTLNPNEVLAKIKRRTGDIANDKIKAKELFEMNVNQKPKDVKVKELSFYLSGGYHCDESLSVDIVFYVGGNPKKISS
jgi:hypothetical protein